MTKAEVQALKKLIAAANFERADFSEIGSSLPFDADEFIKERTRIYRQTWVLPLIDALIRKYDYKLNGVGEKPSGYNPLTESYKW